MKKVLITGGTGMLGTALIRYLVSKEIRVTLISRPGSKRLDNVPKSPLVDIVECDLKNLLSLKEKLNKDYDTFFHFAWDGTFGEQRNDMYMQNNNIKATLEAVELANHLGCKTFLGAGSQAEYGRVDGIKLSGLTPTNPETGYGIAKLCAGKMSKIVCEKYGIKHVWVRILSTYGPLDGAHTMVMSAITGMKDGGCISCTKGEQMWDYLYCEDAARALYLAAEKGKDGAVYPIGSGEARPLKEYISIIRDQIDTKRHIGFGEVPYYDKQVMYLCADIEELTNDTGFVPEISFEEGIKKTMEWCRG